MINRTDLQRLAPTQRADILYRGARAELDERLWRAALGDAGGSARHDAAPSQRIDLDALVRSLVPENRGQPASPAPPSNAGSTSNATGTPHAPALGPNAQHGPALSAAAERTGIPAAALAAIIDAEAAKGPNGSWQSLSRNPRSSAAGLGQFLSGTWVGEAERRGTWLNTEAGRRGWLDGEGQVRPDARSSLLALRYDPFASVQATADYARHNLDRLQRAGAAVGSDVSALAKAAYLAHHLGPGDAIRFLGKGLSSARAEALLAAQVGRSAATSRIAAAGEPAYAHRQWLTAYVDRHIRPEKFLA